MSGRIHKPDTPADIELRNCLGEKNSFVMVAGAGSGKTTSLIKALKYIDETEGKLLRQEGKKIACITYTTAAEKEILDDVGHDTFFHVSTIHSFLWALIRPFQTDIKKWVEAKIQSKIDKLDAERAAWTNRTRQNTRDKNTAEKMRYLHIQANISAVTEFSYETGSKYLEGILGHSDIIAMVPFLIQENQLLRIILSNKYPYFFIDESQDTIADFVKAMKKVQMSMPNFCLGFFGDPMQKIYHTGSGDIALEEGWEKIQKPENFRCSKAVLDVLNNIRAKAPDGLQQKGGRKILSEGELQPVIGNAKAFIMLADDYREDKILNVRKFMSSQNGDSLWMSDEEDSDVKVLVIEHRMAASRLKFAELYSVFKDDSTDSLGMSFSEGTSWAMLPFQRYLIPLLKAFCNNENFKVVSLLRDFCPLLQKSYLQTATQSPEEILAQLKVHIETLNSYLDVNNNTKVRQVLEFMTSNSLIKLDERLNSRLVSNVTIPDDEEANTTDQVIARYFNCAVKEMWGYDTYINDESPYSTQHSIKGAEFNRVVAILDDEEGRRSTSYSYEKLLGIKELSETDELNISNGTDSSIDRTRRLLYVCCSRSLTDLAVILFASDVSQAERAIIESNIFEKNAIHIEGSF